MSQYFTIRDDVIGFMEATKRRRLSNTNRKFDAVEFGNRPVYLTHDVRQDVIDIIDSLQSQYKSNANDQSIVDWLNSQADKFIGIADDYVIEMPPSEIAFRMESAITIAKGSDDCGDGYALGLYFRDREWIGIAGFQCSIQKGRFGYSRADARLGKDIASVPFVNKKSLKVRHVEHRDVFMFNLAIHAFLVAIAFGQLLNAKNAEVVDKRYTGAEEREFYRKYGKRKLPRYRILTINRPTFLTDSHDHGDANGKPEKRRHHVRGHFRTYRHERYRPEQRGTYWIRPHWRGSEALGVIDTPVHVRNHSARN
jgi:hypothetical protein